MKRFVSRRNTSHALLKQGVSPGRTTHREHLKRGALWLLENVVLCVVAALLCFGALTLGEVNVSAQTAQTLPKIPAGGEGDALKKTYPAGQEPIWPGGSYSSCPQVVPPSGTWLIRQSLMGGTMVAAYTPAFGTNPASDGRNDWNMTAGGHITVPANAAPGVYRAEWAREDCSSYTLVGVGTYWQHYADHFEFEVPGSNTPIPTGTGTPQPTGTGTNPPTTPTGTNPLPTSTTYPPIYPTIYPPVNPTGTNPTGTPTLQPPPTSTTPPPTPSPTLKPPTSSEVPTSICAGAVPSAVHQATLNFTLSDQNGPLVGKTVTFNLTYSNLLHPATINPISATTNINGVATTTLTSSRKIGTTATVTATYGALTATAGPITMRAAEGRRRYGIREFNQGFADDLGWDFNAQLLFQRGDQVQGKFYLKFRKDTSLETDAEKMYFTVGGTPALSIDTDVDGWISKAEYDNAGANANLDNSKWAPVNGHQLRISIAQIVLADGSLTIDDDYAFFVNAQGFPVIPSSVIDSTTGASGDVYFQIKAGPLIHRCREIKLKVLDLTQKAP